MLTAFGLGRICALFVSAYAGGSAALSDEIRYVVNDWCLAHRSDAVTFATGNSTARAASPRFLVPFHTPTVSDHDEPTTTGLSVSYWKRDIARRNARISLVTDPPDDCRLEQVGDGLVSIERADPSQSKATGLSQCRETKGRQILAPADQYMGYGAVRISCDDNSAIIACRMTTIFDTGWEANLALPKDRLDQWQAAADAAEDFFDQYLRDCSD